MSSEGNGTGPGHRVELIASAEPGEAAAIIAAVERFLGETAPAPASQPPGSAWQQAALLEGTTRVTVRGPGQTRGGNQWRS